MVETGISKNNVELTKKNDFIGLYFSGKNLSNNEIFDTNIKEIAEKNNLNLNPEALNPLVICIGQAMVISGLDKELENKEINKTYNLKLSPEQGFGKRYPELIKLIPLKVFTEKNIRPEQGMTLALDNHLVRVLSVSGGRVTIDFNNPLAGKDIEYEFTIKNILENKEETLKQRINALQRFYLGKEFDFEIKKEKDKTFIVFNEKKLDLILNSIKPKFKEILDIEIQTDSEKEKDLGTKQEN